MYIVTNIYCEVLGNDFNRFFCPQLSNIYPSNISLPDDFKLKQAIEAPGFTDLTWGERYVVTVLVDGEVSMAVSKEKIFNDNFKPNPVKIKKITKKMFKKFKKLALYCNYE